MPVLEVVAPGMTTTLQDGGRVGAARWGVPRSGPVDALAHRLAARLAGVPAAAVGATPTIEVGPHPCRLVVHEAPVTVALAGAGAVCAVGGAQVAAPCVVVVAPGEALTVTARTWAYVAVAGDLDVPAVLGSHAHHPRSGLGPALAAGTRLAVTAPRPVRPGTRPAPAHPDGPLHVLPAPQTAHFAPEVRALLVDAVWRTTTTVDRMGARLDGPALHAADGHDIVSDGIVVGSIQVPGDGRPFVLTADHQTTGGYPKLAVLAQADLARFVRLPPGEEVRFAWSDVATARDRLRVSLDAIEDCVAAPPRPDGHTIGAANLISGVAEPTPDTP